MLLVDCAYHCLQHRAAVLHACSQVHVCVQASNQSKAASNCSAQIDACLQLALGTLLPLIDIFTGHHSSQREQVMLYALCKQQRLAAHPLQLVSDAGLLLGVGGNVDDRRMGIGATMYYPVAVEGGLISMGDAHTAQGDSEFDGEAVVQMTFVAMSSVAHETSAVGALSAVVDLLTFVFGFLCFTHHLLPGAPFFVFWFIVFAFGKSMAACYLMAVQDGPQQDMHHL